MVKSSVDDSTVDMLDTVVVYPRPNGRVGVSHMNYEKSLTQQCFADSADVNKIMARWLSGGPPPVSDASRAVFMDVSHGMDYQTMLDTTMAVQESFDELPAAMRERFKNDPAVLLDFMADPRNHDEATQLGLLFDDAKPMMSVSTHDGGSAVSPSPNSSSLDVTVRTDSALV